MMFAVLAWLPPIVLLYDMGFSHAELAARFQELPAGDYHIGPGEICAVQRLPDRDCGRPGHTKGWQ